MELSAPLRAFAGFVRRGSFTSAAEELRISQPAVSKHIADMERALGVTLIERRSRRLTSAGEFVAGHVLRAEAILARAARGVAALREPGMGELSLLASGTPGTYLLPDLIAAFQKAHPAMRISFGLGTSAEVVAAVRTHRAEIGIAGGFVAVPEIEAEPLIEDEIVIVGAPCFRGKRLTRNQLETLTWITREDGSATSLLADRMLADLGIKPDRRLALPAWESIKLVVRRGHGVAAFSRLALTEELEAGTLVIIPFAPWKVRRTFSIVRIRDTALSPAAQSFVSMLRARWGRQFRNFNKKPT
jgi:LysR family transcriptional regulator, transcriptional activator of the cysJI operon